MQIEDDIRATGVTDGTVIEVSEVAPGRRPDTDDLVVDLRPDAERRARRRADGHDHVHGSDGPADSDDAYDGGTRRAVRDDRADAGHGILRGRIAVVTGGASGVGREIALALAHAGARVCVLGRDLAQLRETVDLAGPGAAILFLQCDVGSVAEIEGVVDFIERFDRPVDILVHGEGVQVRGGVEFGSVNDLDEQYLVNVRGPYVMSQRLMAQLRAARGHVVFLNASTAHQPDIEFGQFSVTNHGVRALADTLRHEVEGDGVRVTSIYAGAPSGTSESGLSPALSAGDIAESVLAAVQISDRVEITDVHLRPRVGAQGAGAGGSTDDSSV